MQKLVTPLTRNIIKWITKNFGSNGYKEDNQLLFHFPNYQNKKGYLYGWHVDNIESVLNGYTMVSEEYFLENALKSFELIGYRLNGRITKEQAACVLDCLPTNNADNCFMSINSVLASKVKQLGILETCFEEVYKEEIKPLQETFTRNEVINLCTNAYDVAYNTCNVKYINKGEFININQWIENNLK